MSSFTTNNNTRRTKRSRTINSVHVGSQADSKVITNNSIVVGKNSLLVETVIGSHNSKGLVIVGGSAGRDLNQPFNPDERDIPLGESTLNGDLADTLANPPFPVSFLGPGYLKFQNEISVPSIKGDVTINGNLLVTGSVTAETLAGLSGPEAVELFDPVVEDSAGNEFDGVTVRGTYEANVAGDTDHYTVTFSWTGKTNISAVNAIRITGFPFTDYVASQVDTFESSGVFTTQIGASHIVTLRGTGVNGVDLKAHDTTSGTRSDVLGFNFLTSGSMYISGFLKRT